jgi:phosphotransferase system HPr (HPr) family protein
VSEPGGTVVRRAKVVNRLGFHARPCSDLAVLAKRFRADVRVAKGDADANVRSVFDLMLLDVVFGDEVEVRAVGVDAAAAADAVAALIAGGFGEERGDPARI